MTAAVIGSMLLSTPITTQATTTSLPSPEVEFVVPIPIVEPETIEELIARVAEEYAIPTTTLFNLAYSESRLKPDAIGDNGRAVGITQIHLDYWKEVTREQALDPEFNLRWAAEKIKDGKEHLWTACNCYSLVKTKRAIPRMAEITPNSEPLIGSVAVFRYSDGVKHIAYVTDVGGGTVTVQEANFTKCKIGTRVIHLNDPFLIGFYM